MIFIRRDASLIPQRVIDVATRAQTQLEALPPEDRKDFVKKKSHIWRSFSKHLKKMSYGKCWYSESKDAGANFDVDHFRPKSEAKRSEEFTDEEGYAWLAFDWTNYRLSAQNCNRLNKDEKTGQTMGKGTWFPLQEGSPKATWDNRCESTEQPVLLDPIKEEDTKYIDFSDLGRFAASRMCVGVTKKRVNDSAFIYGLNLEQMREARFQIMSEVKQLYENIEQTVDDMSVAGDAAPMNSIESQISTIQSKTRADALFSSAVRAQLKKLGADDYFYDRSLDPH